MLIYIFGEKYVGIYIACIRLLVFDFYSNVIEFVDKNIDIISLIFILFFQTLFKMFDFDLLKVHKYKLDIICYQKTRNYA